MGDRRAVQQQLLALVGARVADALVPLLHEAGPVRREGAEQGDQVGRADQVDAAGEGIRGEGHADQGGVAAVAAAHDRDLVRRGDTLLHRPLRSEEHTSELQSLMRISYAVFCLKKKKKIINLTHVLRTDAIKDYTQNK